MCVGGRQREQPCLEESASEINLIDPLRTNASGMGVGSSVMTPHPGARNKHLGPGGYRGVLGRTLLRERLELGDKRWTLQQQLAVFRNRSPDWSSPRTKAAEGRVEVPPSPVVSPSGLPTDLPISSRAQTSCQLDCRPRFGIRFPHCPCQ